MAEVDASQHLQLYIFISQHSRALCHCRAHFSQKPVPAEHNAPQVPCGRVALRGRTRRVRAEHRPRCAVFARAIAERLSVRWARGHHGCSQNDVPDMCVVVHQNLTAWTEQAELLR